MFSKLRTLTAVCGVAVLAISAVTMACPNDAQQVAVKSQCGSQKTAAVQVANTKQQCSKSRKASTVAVKSQCGSQKTAAVQVANTKQQCSKSRKASTVAVASKKAGCAKSAATTETLALLAKAISTMPACDARSSVVTAYRTMAKANPTLVCEKQCAAVKAVLANAKSTCSSAKTIAVAGKSAASGCCVSQTSRTRATQVANTTTCDPAACAAACRAAAKATKVSDAAACAAAKAKGAKVAAFGPTACSKSKQARYVAFGCKKTDKLARTAARGYLDLIRDLKTYSGADGCAVSAASKLLAQMIQDESARAQVQTPDVKVETVSNIQTPVALGAVSDVKKTKRSQCSAGKK